MCFGCSQEPSHPDGSFEYPQHICFGWEIRKILFSYALLSWGLKMSCAGPIYFWAQNICCLFMGWAEPQSPLPKFQKLHSPLFMCPPFAVLSAVYFNLARLSHRLKMSVCDPLMSVIFRPPVVYQSTICFKQHLLNHAVKFQQTLQEWSLGGHLSKLFKDFHSMPNSVCHSNQKEKL